MKLKVDVVKELGAEAVKQQELVKEVKGLLAAAHDDDEAIISALNIDVNRRVRDAALSATAQRKHASVLPNGSSITRKDLLRVGMKYNLKVRPTHEYIGVIPPELGAAVARFVKEAGIPSMEHAANRFYIMAPPAMFTAKSNEEINREFPTAPRDPVLLYSMNRENYDVVYKWGADFTIGRRILGVVKAARFHGWLGVIAALSLILLALALPTMFFMQHRDHTCMHGAEFVMRFILVLVGVIGFIVSLVDHSDVMRAEDVSMFSESVFVQRGKGGLTLYGFSVKKWFARNGYSN